MTAGLEGRHVVQVGRRRGLTPTARGWAFAVVASVALAALAPVGSTAVAAPVDPPAGVRASGAPAPATGTPAPASAIDVHGGYVAAGTGLRNRGSGSIRLTGIPSKATVVKAYLYWSIQGSAAGAPASFAAGRLNGTDVTGSLVGSGPGTCEPEAAYGFAYRADVSTLVTHGGTYSLSNFASGRTDGVDPWLVGSTAPLVDGASLVAVFEQAGYPHTRVLLADGYATTDGATLGTAMSWGFPATDPVPQVRTTYLGGGGQATDEPASGFNGFAQSKVDWDGTDPQAAGSFSQGNLWDTDTVSVGRRVRPGHTAAIMTVTGGPDCISWIAQILSIGFDGGADSDGDALLDGWEANGNDADGNGTFDVNLQSFGASVVHKDVFVEMDSMGAEATCPCHLPLAPELDRIVAAFATSPYADNPDGTGGIRIHLDAGAARGTKYDLGGGNVVAHDDDLNPVTPEFNALKAANFDPLRAKTFHYMIWAHGYDAGTSSGLSFGIGADSFVVTLGRWSGHGSEDAKVGTFIHELGHNLGLGHGGNDLITNYKPNYLSVMNYFFQVTGIPRTSGPSEFSYSRRKYPALTEAALDEAVGLAHPAADTYTTRWFCPDGTIHLGTATANGPTDWNCDGTPGGTVSVDINHDAQKSVLGGWRDWGNLLFDGGNVGPGSLRDFALRALPPSSELTYEESLQLHP